MTLKLVANVTELPVENYKDIARSSRKFADNLDAGHIGEPRRAVVVLDSPDGVMVEYWGEVANGLEIVGLLEVAKLRVFQANEEDDE